MKKKYLVLLCVLALAALGTASTLAAITVRARTTNVITTGTVNVKLVQKTTDEQGQTIIFTPKEMVKTVPGARFTQMPYAQNTGTEDCYLRMAVQTNIVAEDGETILPNVLKLDIDNSQWVLDGEGWYRYVNVVESGDETPVPLFTNVFFPLSMDNRYVGATMELTLSVQGVQAEYNQYQNSVLEVKGFPEGTLTGSGASSGEGTT